mmetsp:Transcript_14116/g.20529  ORF Transcript_14116/g.20529 Transcript_14116/m.20529 type:complete len:92 (-) Transcript_14116:1330-1605(-)
MQNTMMVKLKGVPIDGDKFYVLYMRDLDVKTARAWNKRYLTWMQRKFRYRKWRRLLKTQHFNFVELIKRDVGDPGSSFLPGSWKTDISLSK